MTWDPALYLEFGPARLRPARDLLQHVAVDDPDLVVDLGCGTGHVTGLLKERWPTAHIVGVDRSEEMLAQAKRDHGDLDWQCVDIGDWRPVDEAPSIIYSNAALHWLDDHATLFPRLMGHLRPGGVLAVQMPHNYTAPSHTCLPDAVGAGPWRDRLRPLLRSDPVADPQIYFDLLSSLAESTDIWETTYLHVLSGTNPVARWTSGSLLRPLLAALDDDQTQEFLAAYEELVAAAYPPREDGRTLFEYTRLFVIARREG